MNLTKLISDSLRGEPPRSRDRQSGGLDISPPAEFLEREVWPLLRETRQALDARGFTAIAVPAPPGDASMTHSLLIIDECENPEDACSVRFLIKDKRLYAKVKHLDRNDAEPFLLDPPGSVMLVQSIIEDFVFHCLAPRGKKRRASQKPVPSVSRARTRTVPRLQSA